MQLNPPVAILPETLIQGLSLIQNKALTAYWLALAVQSRNSNAEIVSNLTDPVELKRCASTFINASDITLAEKEASIAGLQFQNEYIETESSPPDLVDVVDVIPVINALANQMSRRQIEAAITFLRFTLTRFPG